MKYRLIYLFMTVIISLFGKEVPLNELLKCNLNHVDVASMCDVKNEIDLYIDVLSFQTNYPSVLKTKDWKSKNYAYPNIHPFHKHIVNTIKKLDVKTIGDIGAGAGKISKYIYNDNPNLDITCIEHNDNHIEQIIDNFQINAHIIPPDIQVKANVIKGSLPFLPKIKDNHFDLVFTCTVMMHIPYIPAILAAKELTRISSRYILHVENRNLGKGWANCNIVKPPTMSNVNYQAIDYPKLYEMLGVKTLYYREVPILKNSATYIYFLGEKIKD